MATLDAGALSDHERVALVCELERLKGAAAACQARATDALKVHELPCLMAALTGGLVDERAAVEVVRETATLTREDRGEVDRRIASALPHLAGWSCCATTCAPPPSATHRSSTPTTRTRPATAAPPAR